MVEELFLEGVEATIRTYWDGAIEVSFNFVN